MPVIQAKSAGFCYGVRRAVELAEKTARETGGCVMLGSIIHTANVVARSSWEPSRWIPRMRSARGIR